MTQDFLEQNFVLVILGGWIAVSCLLSALGGWWQLARDFRASGDFLGRTWRFQSASMRFGMGYNGVLSVGADHAGLRLSILFPFRVGHPPLLIPWHELDLYREKRWFIRVARFRIRSHPSVPLVLSERLVGKIEQALGGPFPVGRLS